MRIRGRREEGDGTDPRSVPENVVEHASAPLAHRNDPRLACRAPVLSTRGYESVNNCSPFSGESEATPATRGSRACGPSKAANSAGVR